MGGEDLFNYEHYFPLFCRIVGVLNPSCELLKQSLTRNDQDDSTNEIISPQADSNPEEKVQEVQTDPYVSEYDRDRDSDSGDRGQEVQRSY